MKMEEKNINEKLIIYKYESDTDNKKYKKQDTYNKILKRQNRNASIFSIGIFLYAFSITWLFITIDYFEEKEQNWLWLLSTLIIALVATGLMIFCSKTKPKEGIIKFKYKNEKFFYIALIFISFGVFITFLGIDINTLVTIGLILTDIGIALYIYHNKTKGTKKIGLLKKIIIILIALIISVVLGSLLNYKINQNNDYLNEYSKSAMVIYNEIDRPTLVAKSDNTWYIFTNKYGTNHYELSVSNKPENLNIVYEIDDVGIWNLYANDNYAAWVEVAEDKVTYAYYDKEENQPYELITLDYSIQKPQITNLGLYKDKIYYEVIDYENNNFQIMEYNISSAENKILYSKDDMLEMDLKYNTLNIEDNNLLATACLNGRLSIIHLDLDKTNYNPKVISTNEYNATAFSASYDDEKYALYYTSNKSDKLAIFNKNGSREKIVYKFKSNNYALYDKIKLKDNKLYWIDIKLTNNKTATDNFNLMIYDLKTKNTQKINKIFEFDVNDKTIYALGYYQDNPENVRLYEVYN